MYAGWVYALLGYSRDNPIIKVGRTEKKHPGQRAIQIALKWWSHRGLWTLWAARADDVVRAERLAHEALAGYRLGNISGREFYICPVATVLDVLESVTGNRPYRFPNWLEEIEPEWRSPNSDRVAFWKVMAPAVWADDPSRLPHREAIRPNWREYPRGPYTSAGSVAPRIRRGGLIPVPTTPPAANIPTFRRPSWRNMLHRSTKDQDV